jgi:restriction system protein
MPHESRVDMTENAGPAFVRYFGPVLSALHELGGSARPAEVRELIVRDLNISEEEQAEPMASGSPRFDNQVAWARFYLAKAGFIDSSRRGVWALSEIGRSTRRLPDEEAVEIFRSVQAGFPRSRKEGKPDEPVEDTAPDGGDSEVIGHRQEVLELLRGVPPEGFERFCQRLLREAGFEEVTVTGRSGDGGIDGTGILEVNPLVSFRVLFQCKRYSGSVTPSQVRDFRGAMTGRTDKGIIITTGSFTSEAKREAVREGAPPIELVDADKLVSMLEDLELGLSPIRAFQIERSFFEQFAS